MPHKKGLKMKIKKIIILAVCILAFASISFALIFTPISQAITTGGYVAVRLPVNQSCTSYSLWTEDGASYYIAKESDGSDAIIIPDGLAFSMEQRINTEPAGAILCYAKGTTSTNLVGLFLR